MTSWLSRCAIDHATINPYSIRLRLIHRHRRQLPGLVGQWMSTLSASDRDDLRHAGIYGTTRDDIPQLPTRLSRGEDHHRRDEDSHAPSDRLSFSGSVRIREGIPEGPVTIHLSSFSTPERDRIPNHLSAIHDQTPPEMD